MTFIDDFSVVTISVSDIDRSLRFYRDLLGFRVLGQAQYNENTTAHLLDIGNQHTLRLLSFDTPTKPSMWSLDDLQAGLRHTAFKVRNVDETTARLKQANVEFTLDPVDATGDVRIAFFKDPDGALLEIVQNELHYHVEGPAFGVLPPLKPDSNIFLFDHVAITVSNLDSALAFYTARLGFPVIGQLYFHDERGFVITYLKAGSAVLELFSFSHPTQTNPSSLKLDSVGLKQVSFTISDVDWQVKNLRAAGINILQDTASMATGTKFALVEGPDSVVVEFVEKHS